MKKDFNKMKKELELEEERLDKEDNKLSEKIKQLERKAKHLRKVCSDEVSQKKYLKELVPLTEMMFKVLENYDYDEKLSCNHFGVYTSTKYWNLSMSDRSEQADRTQLVIEVNEMWILHNEVGVSKKTFDNILRKFKRKYGIFESWNGNERGRSISIILKRKIPSSLLKALKKYIPFGINKFSDIFDNNFNEVNKQ